MSRNAAAPSRPGHMPSKPTPSLRSTTPTKLTPATPARPTTPTKLSATTSTSTSARSTTPTKLAPAASRTVPAAPAKSPVTASAKSPAAAPAKSPAAVPARSPAAAPVKSPAATKPATATTIKPVVAKPIPSPTSRPSTTSTKASITAAKPPTSTKAASTAPKPTASPTAKAPSPRDPSPARSTGDLSASPIGSHKSLLERDRIVSKGYTPTAHTQPSVLILENDENDGNNTQVSETTMLSKTAPARSKSTPRGSLAPSASARSVTSVASARSTSAARPKSNTEQLRIQAEEAAALDAEKRAALKAEAEAKRKADLEAAKEAAKAKLEAERKAKEAAIEAQRLKLRETQDHTLHHIDHNHVVDHSHDPPRHPSPRTLAPPSQASFKLKLLEEKKAAEEKEKQLAERIAAKQAEKKQQLEEEKRLQEEKKLESFQLAREESEKKMSALAAKAKADVDRKTAADAARTAALAEAQRKAAEKKEKMVQLQHQASIDAEARATQKAKAEAERKAALLKAKEDAKLESERKRKAAAEALSLVEQARSSKPSSAADRRAELARKSSGRDSVRPIKKDDVGLNAEDVDFQINYSQTFISPAAGSPKAQTAAKAPSLRSTTPGKLASQSSAKPSLRSTTPGRAASSRAVTPSSKAEADLSLSSGTISGTPATRAKSPTPGLRSTAPPAPVKQSPSVRTAKSPAPAQKSSNSVKAPAARSTTAKAEGTTTAAARTSKSPAPSARSSGALSGKLAAPTGSPKVMAVAVPIDEVPSPPQSRSPSPRTLRGRNSSPNREPLSEEEVRRLDAARAQELERIRAAERAIANEVAKAEAAEKAEADRRKLAHETAKRERERYLAAHANKTDADRKAAAIDLEIQKAIRAAKSREAEEAELRALRETDFRRSGLQPLFSIGKDIRIIEQLAVRIDELIQILMNFKCNKNAAEEFAKRLALSATILAALLRAHPNTPDKNYKNSAEELCQVLIEAKKYLIAFAASGFLAILLRGQEPKEKFEEFDAKLMELLADIVEAFGDEEASDPKNALSEVKYDFVVVDESTVFEAESNPAALKQLAKSLGVDLADMNVEDNEVVKQLQFNLHDVTELGAQRQLKHPAVKTFWRLYLSSNYLIKNHELVEYSVRYIANDLNPNISEEELELISFKLEKALDTLDERSDHMISVFGMNQLTKHMDPSLDFIEVLHKIWGEKILKIIPMVTEELIETTIWGSQLQEKIFNTMRTAGLWTVVYGPQLSGKTFRYLVASHQLDANEAVLYIDLKNVKTVTEMFTAVASQLSLCVLSLDDAMQEFYRLIDVTLENMQSQCCVIVDHVNVDAIDQFAPLVKVLKKLQTSLHVAVVLITTSTVKPSSSLMSSLNKLGKLPIGDGFLIPLEIGPLNKDDAARLAKNCDVYDPAILAAAAKSLPGEIVRMQSLRAHELSAIASTQSSVSVDIFMADSFSEYETLCAKCLYYPLSRPNQDGIIFNKAVAWELCNQAVHGNINIWIGCFDKLVSIGWLRKVGDEGYIIAASSVLPTRNISVFISEADQWERYYRFWCKETVRINDLMNTRNQLLGCAFFDNSRQHFESMLFDFGSKPVLHGRVRPNVVHELVLQISSNLANILEFRFSPSDGLTFSKSFLRVLCEGDDSGMLSDDRHWKTNRGQQPVIVRAAVNLGWFLSKNNMPEQAEKVLVSALTHINDNDPVNYAYALNKMAIVYRTLGRNDESFETHQRCLTLRVKSLGENHIETAQSLNNIGIVLNLMGRKEDALNIHRRCLKVRLDLLGEKHASSGDTYYNMGTVLKDMGKKDEAMRCYDKAKLSYASTYGEGHAYVKDVNKKMKELKKSMQDPNNINNSVRSVTNN